mmetsp:Transcript_74647/g.178061  ORF Transcript_74647/g.178061 Transcript_74647/m.178061 type:complete len:315 (-) Transcript_74647:2717-3661(-)
MEFRCWLISKAAAWASSGSPCSFARKRWGSEGTSSALRFSLRGTTSIVAPSSISTCTMELGTYALSLMRQVTRAAPSFSITTWLPSVSPKQVKRVPSGRTQTEDSLSSSTSMPSSFEMEVMPVCGSSIVSMGTGSSSYSILLPSSTSTASRMSCREGGGSGGSGSLSRSSSSAGGGASSLLGFLLGGLLGGLLPLLSALLDLLLSSPSTSASGTSGTSGASSSGQARSARPKRRPSRVVTRQCPGMPKYLFVSDGSISSSSAWLASQASQIWASRLANAWATASQCPAARRNCSTLCWSSSVVGFLQARVPEGW